MFRRLKSLSRAVTAHLWRTAIFVVGMAVLLIGLALLPLPGPGTLVVALGLAILSVEFVWAKHGLEKLKGAGCRVRSWARSTCWPERTPAAAPASVRRKQTIRLRRP